MEPTDKLTEIQEWMTAQGYSHKMTATVQAMEQRFALHLAGGGENTAAERSRINGNPAEPFWLRLWEHARGDRRGKLSL